MHSSPAVIIIARSGLWWGSTDSTMVILNRQIQSNGRRCQLIPAVTNTNTDRSTAAAISIIVDTCQGQRGIHLGW